jgi:NAD(P)-dependent dehydrogenase (short-subunit alcohol dehydrogenase family)
MGDRLKDKVALVTGAGSSGPGWGNGKATAVLFAREGAKVLAADINRDSAFETKRIAPPRARDHSQVRADLLAGARPRERCGD